MIPTFKIKIWSKKIICSHVFYTIINTSVQVRKYNFPMSIWRNVFYIFLSFRNSILVIFCNYSIPSFLFCLFYTIWQIYI